MPQLHVKMPNLLAKHFVPARSWSCSTGGTQLRHLAARLPVQPQGKGPLDEEKGRPVAESRCNDSIAVGPLILCDQIRSAGGIQRRHNIVCSLIATNKKSAGMGYGKGCPLQIKRVPEKQF